MTRELLETLAKSGQLSAKQYVDELAALDAQPVEVAMRLPYFLSGYVSPPVTP